MVSINLLVKRLRQLFNHTLRTSTINIKDSSRVAILTAVVKIFRLSAMAGHMVLLMGSAAQTVLTQAVEMEVTRGGLDRRDEAGIVAGDVIMEQEKHTVSNT